MQGLRRPSLGARTGFPRAFRVMVPERSIERVLLTALLLVACGDDPSAVRTPGGDGIGVDGGTVRSQDERAVLVVPAGALGEAVELEVIQTTAPVADADLIDESVYAVRPGGTTFDVAARLTIEYDPAFVPDSVPESMLRLLRAVPQGWNDELVTHVEVDAQTNMVTATIEEGGVYAVFATFGDASPAPRR